MAQAFVLINCELGSEEHIISELKTFDDIEEVHGTFGAYDIIAKVNLLVWDSILKFLLWLLLIFALLGLVSLIVWRTFSLKRNQNHFL